MPRATGIVRSVGAPVRSASDTSNRTSATTISVAWSVARVRGGPVGVGVVRGPGDGGDEHGQDGRHERDVGRGRLTEHVEDDDAEQQTDREVGHGGMERVARASGR